MLFVKISSLKWQLLTNFGKIRTLQCRNFASSYKIIFIVCFNSEIFSFANEKKLKNIDFVTFFAVGKMYSLFYIFQFFY